jgi:hypothetical protein
LERHLWIVDEHRRLALAALDDFPDNLHLFAHSRHDLAQRLGLVGGDHDDHSDTAVEGAVHLGRGDVAGLLEPTEYGRRDPMGGIDACGGTFRQHARQVFGQAAAGDVGKRMYAAGTDRGERRFHVNTGRLQKRLAEGQIRSKGGCVRIVDAGGAGDHANQRKTVGMDPVGGEAEDHVTGCDLAPREHLVAFNGADAESGEVVVTIAVHARHFRRFPTDQRAAGALAAFGDSGNHVAAGFDRQFAGGEIVQEQKRFRTLHHEVVGAHGDEIDADGVMAPGGDGDHQLGADTVGAGDQDGVGEASRLEVEQCPETAQIGCYTTASGGFGKGADGVHQGIASVDVDAGAFVTEAMVFAVIFGWGAYRFFLRQGLDRLTPDQGAATRLNINQHKGFAMTARRSLRMVAWVLSLAVLVFGFNARANVFEVRDVAVDVTAKTAAAAREAALADGEATAFRRLLERLTLSEDHDRLPQFGPGEISPYVSDFSVSGEKTSAVRYLARLHFRFKPEDVRELLRDAGVQFAETPSKPVLVLPVYQPASGLVLWEDPNPWRDAWNQRQSGGGLVRLVLPLGDLGDINALSVQQAVRGEVAALGKLAERYRAGDTVVAYARIGLVPGASGQRVDVSMTRFSPQREPETHLLAVEQAQGESTEDLLIRATNGIADQLEDSWKRENLLVGGEAGVTAITVPITGLADWVDVRKRLAGVAVVRRVEPVLLSLDEVRVNLHYVGVTTQLQTALGQSDLALVREESEWVLYPSGALPEQKP